LKSEENHIKSYKWFRRESACELCPQPVLTMQVSPAVTHVWRPITPSPSKPCPGPLPSPGQSILSCWSHGHLSHRNSAVRPAPPPLPTRYHQPDACPGSGYTLGQIRRQSRCFSLHLHRWYAEHENDSSLFGPSACFTSSKDPVAYTHARAYFDGERHTQPPQDLGEIYIP